MPNKKNISHLNDKLRFLIACCQTEPTQEDTKEILSYLSQITNHAAISNERGQSLTTAASQHGILPLVYKTLRTLSTINHQPSTLIDELKAHYQTIAQRNMLMSAELLRIMHLLERNNIEALAFKGPALSQMAYGDITLRQYSDLDILVDEKEISKAGSVLAEHGYEAAFPIKILENKTCLEATNDLDFFNQSNGLLIELHWKLFREKIGKHLGFNQIGENKQTIVINGKSLSTLSSEMLLAYLCLHGSKHAWERIEWICDIDRLVRSEMDLDWDKTIKIAKEMDTTTPLYLGLKLSHTLFDTPLPEKVIVQTEARHIENLITKTYTILKSTLSDTEGYGRYSAIHMYQMDLLDSTPKRLKHLYNTYLGISRNDCQSFQLPSALKFLYIFIKPFRVAIKYIQYGK